MASDRLFIKVHNGFPEHPKTGDLSDRAFRNLIELWCYCSRNLTDGLVKNAQANKILSPKSRRELVAAGFMLEGSGEVIMNNYLEHQQSAQQVADLRERRAEAGSKGGKAKASRLASARATRKQTPTKPVADTDTDRDTENEPASAGSQVAAAATPAGTVALFDTEPTAQTLVGEWIDHCDKRPPGRVIGQVAKELKTLLDEGIEPERVRAALAEWNRKGLHPSTLASVVHEIGNRAPAAKGQQATNDLFDRAMARAIAKESA